jgi:hypothetical protein
MKFDKNLLVFVGPSASGKTEGINVARAFFNSHNIPYEDIPITDSTSILDQIKLDDRETGGKNHFHEWCEGVTAGHSHSGDDGDRPDLGFTVTGYRIPHGMYKDFTQELTAKRHRDRVYLVEWSGAVSVNSFGDADYSFARMRQEFDAGTYDRSWFTNVLAVIHTGTPSFEYRKHLNHLREGHIPTPDERHRGGASWFLPDSAMNLFHDDDFEYALRPYLEQQGLRGRIHTVLNQGENEIVDGEIGFHKRLQDAFDGVFAQWITVEGKINRDGSQSSTTNRGMR